MNKKGNENVSHTAADLVSFLLVTWRESNWLIENHMISTVIGVPDRLFLNTSIKKGEEHE